MARGRKNQGKTVWVNSKHGTMYKKWIGNGPVPNDSTVESNVNPMEPIVLEPEHEESDSEISIRIRNRMTVIGKMSESCIAGNCKSLIVSGAAGTGKSWTVTNSISKHDPENKRSTFCKGYSSATGVYKSLYEYRNAGNVIVFDDIDSVFKTPASLSILMAALDSVDKRIISWHTETKMKTEDEEPLPRQFVFEGSVIFITNFDFDDAIRSNHPLKEQFMALISRSHYISLGINTPRDYIIRIKQIVYQDRVLEKMGFSDVAQKEIMEYLEKNYNNLRELSIRCVLKIADLHRDFPDNWKQMCDVTVKKVS